MRGLKRQVDPVQRCLRAERDQMMSQPNSPPRGSGVPYDQPLGEWVVCGLGLGLSLMLLQVESEVAVPPFLTVLRRSLSLYGSIMEP